MPDSDTEEPQSSASASQSKPTVPRSRGRAVDEQLAELAREREGSTASGSGLNFKNRVTGARKWVASSSKAVAKSLRQVVEPPPPGTYRREGLSHRRVPQTEVGNTSQDRGGGDAIQEQLHQLEEERAARGDSASQPGFTETVKKASEQLVSGSKTVAKSLRQVVEPPPPGTYRREGLSHRKVEPRRDVTQDQPPDQSVFDGYEAKFAEIEKKFPKSPTPSAQGWQQNPLNPFSQAWAEKNKDRIAERAKERTEHRAKEENDRGSDRGSDADMAL